MKSFDVIIIGAGAGGLSAAASLARAGKKVLVVEQDDHIGGTAHVFRRGGFTFPSGPISVTVPDYITRFLSGPGIEEEPCFVRDHFQVRRAEWTKRDMVCQRRGGKNARRAISRFRERDPPRRKSGEYMKKCYFIFSIITVLPKKQTHYGHFRTFPGLLEQ